MARRFDHALQDILDAIGHVEEETRDQTLSEFKADWRMRYAVQRCIEIISEASRAIPEEMKTAHPEIPWPRVRAIGNIMRHQYEGLSDPIV